MEAEAEPARERQKYDTRPDAHSAPPSADQKLRVSHTMLGVQSPMGLANAVDANEDTPASGTANPQAAHAAPNSGPGSGRSPAISEPPIELPTIGLPPALLGTIVMSAMLLAALLGYLALR